MEYYGAMALIVATEGSTHPTLSGTVRDSVYIPAFNGVEVVNRSGAGPLTVDFGDGVATGLAPGGEVVMPGQSKLFYPCGKVFLSGAPATQQNIVRVSVAGDGNAYSVIGVR